MAASTSDIIFPIGSLRWSYWKAWPWHKVQVKGKFGIGIRNWHVKFVRNNWNTICSLWSINDQTISINCHPFAWKVLSDCLSCEVCEKELKWNLQLMNHKWSLQAIACHVKFVRKNWNKIYSLWTINDQTISINCHPFAWKV